MIIKLKNFFKNKNKVLTLFFFFLLIESFLVHDFRQDNADEGIITSAAWQMINGKELYFDIFEFIPPGSFYLIFYFWKIFGASFIVAKIISILVLTLCAIGIFKASEQIDKNNIFNYFPPLIFVFASSYWPIINHNLFNLCFIIWSLFFLLKAQQTAKPYLYSLSGLLAGFSVVFLQHKGLLFLFCVSSFLFLNVFKNTYNNFQKLISFFLSSLLPVSLLFIKWPPSLLFHNLIYTPFFKYTEINKMTPIIFYFYLAFFLYFSILLLKSKHKTLHFHLITFLLYTQLLFLLSSLQRPDFYHLNIAIFILFILSPFFVSHINTLKKFYLICFNYTVLFIFTIIIIAPSIINFALIPRVTNDDYEAFTRQVKDNCKSDYLFSGPFMPQFYLMTKKLNPTKYDVILTGHTSLDQLEKAKKDVEEKKPDCLILDYTKVQKFKYNQDNIFDRYLKNNYKELTTLENSGVKLYIKN